LSICDAIGGAPSVTAAVDQFYTRVLADPELEGYFVDSDLRRLKAHQRRFIATALGGPEIFSGRSMKDAHAGRGITGVHFDRVVSHLAETLAELGLPADTIGEIASALLPLRTDIVEIP
jgi:hemoglobin